MSRKKRLSLIASGAVFLWLVGVGTIVAECAVVAPGSQASESTRLKTTLHPQSPAAFIIGADISWAQQQEDEGRRFSDNGTQKDIFDILKDHGFNYVRLRIFHNPKAPKGYSREGYCDLVHTLQMARRIKAAGMRFLLDFHYSNTWADPGRQHKPEGWQELHFDELVKGVHDYTKQVMIALKDQGPPPQMVQIGNEINHGFLWPDGSTKDWDQFAALLKAGIQAVKETNPSARILTRTYQSRQTVWVVI